LAGQFAGVHNGALIVAGGSHFPVSKWAGGRKVWVSDVFVLERPEAQWRKFDLPQPLAYGGSASHAKGLLLIGGGDADRNHAACLWLRWTGRSLEVGGGPVLPVPLANCAAAVIAEQAFVVGGQQSPTATAAERTLYSLDLRHADAGWKAEMELPGRGRILPSVAAAGGHLYVAGGASLDADADGQPARDYLSDAWRFTPGIGWNRLPSLPEPAAAAPAFGLGDSFFVLGGSDGFLAPREAELRDQHPGFSRSVKVFHPGKWSWQILDWLLFSLVTTTSVIWNGLVVVPGGEDRPAHRSNAVYAVPHQEVIVAQAGAAR
jgi:N-acetylneuraminic acid mutarotase